MPDVLDPEPSDKRTSEWKAWSARQSKAVVDIPPPATVPQSGPTAQTMADAATFIAAYIPGHNATTRDPGSALACAQRDWHQARQFLAWVRSGDDVVAYNLTVERQRQIAEIAENDARAVREQEEAERKRRIAAFGAKTSSVAV